MFLLIPHAHLSAHCSIASSDDATCRTTASMASPFFQGPSWPLPLASLAQRYRPENYTVERQTVTGKTDEKGICARVDAPVGRHDRRTQLALGSTPSRPGRTL